MTADDHHAGSDICLEDTGELPSADRLELLLTRVAVCAVAAVALLAAGASHARDPYVNAESGAPLRPGVYGRVEVHGVAPPLISPRPLIAKRSIGPVQGEPLYFYLPPGQVRKWPLYCQHYAACERPVYFVRMDDTPGKLGRWKSRERVPNDRQATTLAADADSRF